MTFKQRSGRQSVLGLMTAGLVWLHLIVAGPSVTVTRVAAEDKRETTTPIKHLVVIFQENVSFGHYFATYPGAENPGGQPRFDADPHTPRVDNLVAARLLSPNNPNSSQPFRLDRSQADTCDQNHDYMAEQAAADDGQMDKFVEFTGVGSATSNPCADYSLGPSIVMGYFDGNTVTALWNYAQHFAMSDNSFNSTWGPSTPGALNLVSGQTHGAIPDSLATAFGPDVVEGTVIGDPQPFYDDCSTRETVKMTGRNIGDLLSAQNIPWGWFEGGFKPSTPATATTKAECNTAHTGANGKSKKDYIPHHEPFQYYASTSNPHHLPPTSVALIGHDDQANHQYDLSDFWDAAEAGNLPAVSFLKAPAYQDGHADYSSPLLEQTFLVDTLNKLQRLPEWEDMAVIITYDDSDGWYDHVTPPLVNHSQTSEDLSICNARMPNLGDYQGRCGHGPRVPLLIISPFAKVNFVDHTPSDASSVLRFIEDNWDLGRIGDHSFDERANSLVSMFDFGRSKTTTLFLDSSTGELLP